MRSNASASIFAARRRGSASDKPDNTRGTARKAIKCTERSSLPAGSIFASLCSVTGAWANKPLSLYGRNSASGTYGFFKSKALGKGDYKDHVKEQPGSASVVQGITEDKFAIGYSGIGYLTSGVRAIPLSKKADGEMFAPTFENVVNKSYPLARYLYMYVVKEPGKEIDPLVREFMKFVLSKEGQEIVVKDGYLPIPAEIAKAEIAKLDQKSGS